jgi:transposase-like protein
LLAKLAKAVVERALGAELTHHLGYARGGSPAGDNCRNGTSTKTLLGEGGRVEIAVPRDRHSTFEPRLIAKGQKRFEGFDEKIIAMYARGMRKVLKNRGHFPSEEAAGKLIYLALRNIVKQWKNPPTHWGAAAHQFALKFGERFFSSPSASEKP